jgi:hypothetical protein
MRAVATPLKQPVQPSARRAVGELVCEHVAGRLVRALARRADQPDQLIDRRSRDPLDVQLLGGEREVRLRALVLRARAGVALQAAHAAVVAALGHQQRQLHVVLGEMRQRGVTELMQRPAS